MRVDVGGVEPCGAGTDVATYLGGEFLKHLKVGVAVVGADIDDEAACVGYDVVLCSAVDHGDGHLDGSKQR